MSVLLGSRVQCITILPVDDCFVVAIIRSISLPVHTSQLHYDAAFCLHFDIKRYASRLRCSRLVFCKEGATPKIQDGRVATVPSIWQRILHATVKYTTNICQLLSLAAVGASLHDAELLRSQKQLAESKLLLLTK